MKLDIIWLDSAKHVGDTGWVNGFNPFPINYSHKSCGFATTELLSLIHWIDRCTWGAVGPPKSLRICIHFCSLPRFRALLRETLEFLLHLGFIPKSFTSGQAWRYIQIIYMIFNDIHWTLRSRLFIRGFLAQVRGHVTLQGAVRFIGNGECWEKQQFSMKLKVWFGEWKIVSVKFSTLVLVYVKLDWLSWHFLLLSIFGPGNPATVWWNMTMWGRHLMPTRATQFQLNHSRSWKRIQRKDALKHGFD